MKTKIFLTVLLAAALPTVAVWGAPRVIEAYQGADIYISNDGWEIATVASLDFSTDTTCLVQIVTGGAGTGFQGWIVLDSDSLDQWIKVGSWGGAAMSFFRTVMEGEHTMAFKILGGSDPSFDCNFRKGYLQVCIFEPDEPSAVVELPVNDTPESRAERVYRVGDLIEVKIDAAVYDASGRLVERPMGCFAPESSGVYYITGEERIRKVVVQ